MNLNETQYVAGHMQEGHVKKVPMYENLGYGESAELISVSTRCIQNKAGNINKVGR